VPPRLQTIFLYYDCRVVDVDEETREIRIEFEDGETDNYDLNELSRDRIHLLSDSENRSPAYRPIVETVCSKPDQCAKCKIAAIRCPNFQICSRCTSAKKNGSTRAESWRDTMILFLDLTTTTSAQREQVTWGVVTTRHCQQANGDSLWN